MGEFNIHVSELNLFDVDRDIRGKLQLVQGLVSGGSSSNFTACTSVLEQFHSACDPNKESCSNANQQTFQVTTEQGKSDLT